MIQHLAQKCDGEDQLRAGILIISLVGVGRRVCVGIDPDLEVAVFAGSHLPAGAFRHRFDPTDNGAKIARGLRCAKPLHLREWLLRRRLVHIEIAGSQNKDQGQREKITEHFASD